MKGYGAGHLRLRGDTEMSMQSHDENVDETKSKVVLTEGEGVASGVRPQVRASAFTRRRRGRHICGERTRCRRAKSLRCRGGNRWTRSFSRSR